jgi:glycerol-3-phosphate acyltransferase PlsX
LATKVIALDAMGGDNGASVVVPAAIISVQQHDDLELILVGDEELLESMLRSHDGGDNPRIHIQHASEVVTMDEPPALALRGKKDSSMRVAINLVKEGRAQACVSAGNTGALMATARFVLKTLPGIDRPAISSLLPTASKQQVVRVLDLGANVDSTAEHLFQFAVMGSIAAESVDNIPSPRVALLNIGQEDIKGNEQVKQSAEIISQSEVLNYIGFVEADDIYTGKVDVVVCDGFVGNVALKSSEGTAKLILNFIKHVFAESWYGRLAAIIAYPVLRKVKRQADPARYNGASMLGLRGIVVKSHGNAGPLAFANAINQARLQVKQDVPRQINDKVEQILLPEVEV